jgi:osmotically-inducible protein OsmY
VGIISRRDILRAMVRSDDVLTAEVQHRLDEYAGGPHWTAVVEGGIVRLTGEFRDETEQGIVAVLARTVPGVAAVDLAAANLRRTT